MNPKWEEQIVVVKRSLLFDSEKNVFQGILIKDTDHNITKGQKIIKALNQYEIMRRGSGDDPTPKENNAEINTDYKQPIPYAVIRRGSELFVYERLSGGGEGRLHNKISIGVGGHMNDLSPEEVNAIGEEFVTFYTLLSDNLERELSEELYISDNDRQAEIIGFVNDDSEDVSKVHIGILAIIDISEDSQVEVLEKDQLAGRWMTIEQLLEKETYDRLESWSRIVVDALK